jgi:hypothetical protein
MTRLQKKARKDRVGATVSALVISVALLGGILYAPVSAAPVSWSWSAPTTGTPAHHYVVEVRVEGGSWVRLGVEPTTPTVFIDMTPNLSHEVRVAALDAQGHQGGWSPVSAPEVYGAPGACGKPGVD